MNSSTDDSTNSTSVSQEDTVEITAKSEIDAVKAEAEQWHDRFLRKAAELENFRKRSDRDRLESANSQKSYILSEFLSIMDACERALKSFEDEEDRSGKLQKYRQGVELLYKQLADSLNRMGVVPMEVKGKSFDPHLHEALSNLESMELEENTIVEELRRGYLLNGRMLRPAQVVIATRPK
jgi:molecular chaperone GrpE